MCIFLVGNLTTINYLIIYQIERLVKLNRKKPSWSKWLMCSN
jgi:hypothetical protein